MNFVWLLLIVLAVLTAGVTHHMADVSSAAFSSAKAAVEFSIGLIGVMALFLGLMKIAEAAGLVQALAKAMRPLFKWLFPDVPDDHPALGAIALNMGANMLGLGDAATPMGLKAMQELQQVNQDQASASDAMVIFLALNSSSVQLIPAMMIGLRASAASAHPSEIILPTLVATTCSTVVAVTAAKVFSKLPYFKQQRHQAANHD